MRLKLLLLAFSLWFCSVAAFAAEASFVLPRFGNVHIYGTEIKAPTQVILFLSGDGGWNKGVVDMAKTLAGQGAVVAGINVPEYLKNLAKTHETCHYLAADLESLSQYLQKRLGIALYVTPTLVGYSSGATLVYGALAQAPPNTFRGGMSLGFCPGIVIDKPLCKGSGLTLKPMKPKGFELAAKEGLTALWYVMNGQQDQVCRAPGPQQFVAKIPKAKFQSIPFVGHGFANRKNWLPQFLKTSLALASSEGLASRRDLPSLEGLPLIEVNRNVSRETLIVVLSGDGGWADIDKGISEVFADHGYAVIGLDSLRYFWSEKTPEKLAQDLTLVADHYLKRWKLKNILWIGYSMGADVLPFAINRLQPDLKAKTKGITLLGLSKYAEFEMKLTNWLGSSDSTEGKALKPELELLKGSSVFCVHGEGEKASGCQLVQFKGFTQLALPGGHHFGGEYDTLVDLIKKNFQLQ